MKIEMSRGKAKSDELEEVVQHLFRERGQKALKIAKEMMFEEIRNVSSHEAHEAIKYFINEYWNDLASPTLVSLGCESVGGDIDDTIPLALPMILMSGGIDVHDDIIDKSKMKYGRLTVFGKYGDELALLVGDALLLKGFTLLCNATRFFSQKKFLDIVKIVNNMFFELGDAETLERKLRKNLDTTPKEYILNMEKKAADIEGLLRIGAIIGDGSTEEIDALGCYGRIFGLLSILRDDWIDMLDYQEAIHRLQFENLPLPTIYTLGDVRARLEIERIFEKEEITKQDAERLFQITDKFGGFKQTTQLMLNLARKAKEQLMKANINNNNLLLLLEFIANID